MEKKNETQRLRTLPKFPQLLSELARSWTWALRLQIWCSSCGTNMAFQAFQGVWREANSIDWGGFSTYTLSIKEIKRQRSETESVGWWHLMLTVSACRRDGKLIQAHWKARIQEYFWRSCFSYHLLYNKPPQNLMAQNYNRFTFSHNSGNWEDIGNSSTPYYVNWAAVIWVQTKQKHPRWCTPWLAVDVGCWLIS